MRLGLYATTGHTEAGGLQRFLERAVPGVEVERRLPALHKPPRRLAGGRLEPKRPGLTGSGLRTEVLRMIERYGVEGLDAVLLVDDADCRFGCAQREGLDDFVVSFRSAVRAAANRPELPVFVLLASPEIEAWLLSDLERAFAHPSYLREHTQGADAGFQVRAAIAGMGPPAGGWEAYGCPPTPDGRACSAKLSADLIDALAASACTTRAYSKSYDGPTLLKRIDPDRVRDACTLYARPILLELLRWANASRA